jgi:hypothetical protein
MKTASHPSRIYLKPSIDQHILKRYGFKIIKEQWRGGSSVVYMTIQKDDIIYHGGKYEFYHFHGIGLCECFEVIAVEEVPKLEQLTLNGETET